MSQIGGGQERAVLSYKASARLLSLEGQWFGCTVSLVPNSRFLTIEDLDPARIVGGMSGSPIIAGNEPAAIGLVCLSSNTSTHGPNPYLPDSLPWWLFR